VPPKVASDAASEFLRRRRARVHDRHVPSLSAGLVVYRFEPPPVDRVPAHERGPRLEVLLVHPGGPYWARRDEGWWSIPKGEVGEGEDALLAAEREFTEELGLPAPAGERIALGEVVQAGGKHVRAWAVAGDLDASTARSHTFELEWPPRSGRTQAFPEIDRAEWYGLEEARRKLLPGQLPLLDRLARAVAPEPSSYQGEVRFK
jgi:predicted NUDIX family NTP pyrophosphohydrolase